MSHVKGIRNQSISDSLKIIELKKYCDTTVFDPVIAARAQYEIGHLYSNRVGNFPSALHHYLESFQSAHRFSNLNPGPSTLSAFYVIKTALECGQSSTAKDYLNRLLGLNHNDRYTARGLKDMAAYHRKYGDIILARSCINQALDLKQELYEDEVLNLLIEEVNVSSAENSIDAFRTCVEKRDYAEDVIRKFKSTQYYDSLAVKRYYQNLSYAFEVTGNQVLAKNYLLKCLELEVGKSEFGDVYNNLGLMDLRQGDYDLALSNFETARQYFLTPLDIVGLAGTYDNKAAVYRELGQFELALINIDTAIALMCNTSPNELTSIEILKRTSLNAPLSHLYELLVFIPDKAKILNRRHRIDPNTNDLKNALELWGVSDAIIDEIRKDLGHSESHLIWREMARDIYEPASVTATELQAVKSILRFTERGKSLILYELMQRAQLMNLRNDPRLKEIDAIQRRIDSIQATRFIGPALSNKVLADTSRRAMLVMHQELNDLQNDICKNSPKIL